MTIPKHINKLHIVYPYYENPNMLAIQIANWESYPEEVKKKIEIILVDDGSQNYPAKDVIGAIGLPIRLFRVKKDIPWNQHGARNLGMKHVNGWAFLSDIDMVLTSRNVQKLLSLKATEEYHYTFERLVMPDKVLYMKHGRPSYHCNTFLLSSESYWKINGYDTIYCGSYGGDGPFKRDLESVTNRMHLADVFVHYYPRGYIKDAGTNNYERQGPLKDEYRRRFNGRRDQEGPITWDAVPFEWEEVTLR